MGVKDVTVYTAATDPNHLLGRQGDYTSKIEWITDGGHSGIEAFSDKANAKLRLTPLNDLGRSCSPIFLTGGGG